MSRMTLVATAIAVAASWGYSADQAGTPVTAGTERRVIAPPGPKPVGPYSPGIVAGDFLYVSGQGARDRDGQLPAAVEAQVRQTLDNVKGIVEAAGLTMEHVVYSQVYLHDMAAYIRWTASGGSISRRHHLPAPSLASTGCLPTRR